MPAAPSGDKPERPALRASGNGSSGVGASDQQENGAVIKAAQNPVEL
jgi:hypothetical protein